MGIRIFLNFGIKLSLRKQNQNVTKMGGRKNIDKWSFRYWIAKILWVRRVHNLYYRRVEALNLSRIPTKSPVILAPNHQNALMDAMTLVTQPPFQTVFMARADIFKSPLLIKILTFIKILPVYRIRDGIANLTKNEELFELAAQIINNRNNPLCLFPEGNHGNKRRLRPLVKGIFRIAFKAQSIYGSSPGVKIFPIGLDYEHYQKFRKTLFINVGEPIEVSEYWSLFETDPVAATNKLRDKLSDELRKVMIDIQTEEYYDTYMGIKEFYRPFMLKKLGLKNRSLANGFVADKELIRKMDIGLAENPESIKQIDTLYKRYGYLRDKLYLRNWVFGKDKYSLVLNLIYLLICIGLTPLFLVGLLTNWPHFFIPAKVFRRIKDPQFQSTAKWGMGIFIQAIYYFILAVLAILFIPWWWVTILFIATFPLTGIIALSIRNFLIKTLARIRYTLSHNKPEIIEIKQKREELIKLLDAI